MRGWFMFLAAIAFWGSDFLDKARQTNSDITALASFLVKLQASTQS